MIPKFNKSQPKKLRPEKPYMGATKTYTDNTIRDQANEYMHYTTRQSAYHKARHEADDEDAQQKRSVFSMSCFSAKALACFYIKKGVKRKKAYEMAYAQLKLS
ncbi:MULTISPECIES: hypothetical protein [Cysteiniphilum]|uniref:Uncharacterized protein n=1 Tax=Cysteiniphilum litorale TaxID=2056700 RepID=A0A8J2Z720_9GAMM|nr:MULTISPECIES: hypothetical protein [Cysteiniphilum]GGG08201.1 hypothetical protein GCM10010995_27190 [Cysteiniphilum litorale]